MSKLTQNINHMSDDYQSISKFDSTATDTNSAQGHEGAEAGSTDDH